MHAADFQRFIGSIGELTGHQREMLASVLAGDERTEALALIAARFAELPACGHCGSHNVQAWGRRGGLARLRCRDCGRTFNALTGTPLARLRMRDAWVGYARTLVDGLSVRKAARMCGLDPSTAFRWRHRFLARIAVTKPEKLDGIVEADESYFLRSEKGSRHLDRPARHRGGTGTPANQGHDQVPVLIACDRFRHTTDAIMLDKSAASITAVLEPVVAKDALLVSDGAPAYRSFANAAGLLHVALAATAGERTWGVYHIQHVNAYASRLRLWMHRFRGVATRYLASYLGWHRLLDRQRDHITAEACLAAALA